MARTIQEIYDAIIQEKEQQTELSGLLPSDESASNLLSDLTSSSKVAIWRLWAWVIAVGIRAHELLFDDFVVEANAIADSAPAGTPRWYQAQLFIFQYGDALVYTDNKYQYSVLDESKQIIKRAAIEQRPDGVVVAKIAKEIDGNPLPLDGGELSAVESYMAKIKFAGTRLAVLSLNADVVNLDYTIYYDPIISLAVIQANVQLAIDNFQNNLSFNGKINVTKFTDTLQTVEGVIDPVFDDATGTPNSGTSESFSLNYLPAAGYFDYADTAVNMFTWTPQIES